MNYTIVSCTKETEKDFYKKTPLGRSLCKINVMDLNSDVSSMIFFENTKGISECYNTALNTIYSKVPDKNEHIVIFIHDDVFINDMFMFEKLQDGISRFDVIGVAGSNDFSLKRIPVTWHNSDRNSWSGLVFHPLKDKSDDINNIYCTDFGNFGKQLAVIDGLFIAANLNKLYENKIYFDEQFKWDHYDTDFSLSCLAKQLKIGTIPIILSHISHGRGLYKESYKITQDRLINKWKKTND